jgi:hypothetical protein
MEFPYYMGDQQQKGNSSQNHWMSFEIIGKTREKNTISNIHSGFYRHSTTISTI